MASQIYFIIKNGYLIENKHESKGENISTYVLEKIFKKPFLNCRPNFLNNDVTGRNLEIDCYNDELQLGVEYSGIQHYIYTEYFTK